MHRLLAALAISAFPLAATADCQDCPMGQVCAGQEVTYHTTSSQDPNDEITFRFRCGGDGDDDCLCGRFAGQWDYWVAPETGDDPNVTILEMLPAQGSVTQPGRLNDPTFVNGYVIDHAKDENHFDSDAGSFDGAPPPPPFVLDVAGSGPRVIVKAVSTSGYNCKDGSSPRTCIQYMEALTVLETPPPGNGEDVLRPPYFGQRKPMFAVDDASLNDEVLPALPDYRDAAIGWDAAIDRLASVGFDSFDGKPETRLERHVPASNYHRSTDPSRSNTVYPGKVQPWLNEAYLQLVIAADPNDADKKKLLAHRVAQRGVDLYYYCAFGGGLGPDDGTPDGSSDGDGCWGNVGGYSQGRAGVMALSALLLGMDQCDPNDPETSWLTFMAGLEIDRRHRNGAYSEIGQIQLLSEVQADSPLFGAIPDGGFMVSSECGDGADGKWCGDPDGYVDGTGAENAPSCPTVYQRWQTWSSFAVEGALLFLIPELHQRFPHPDFIDYAERMLKNGIQCAPDPMDQYGGQRLDGYDPASRCAGGANHSLICSKDDHCPGGDCKHANERQQGGALFYIAQSFFANAMWERYGFDTDGDGLIDEFEVDVDGDGVTDALDNCPFWPNSDQLDSGGWTSGPYAADPNIGAMGDACQCGDMSGDGVVDASDLTLYRRWFAANLEPFEPQLCSVSTELPPRGDCDSSDSTLQRRYQAGLPWGVALPDRCTRAVQGNPGP